MLDKLNCFNFYTCFRSIHIGLPCPFVSYAWSSYSLSDLLLIQQHPITFTDHSGPQKQHNFKGILAAAVRSMALTQHISWHKLRTSSNIKELHVTSHEQLFRVLETKQRQREIHRRKQIPRHILFKTALLLRGGWFPRCHLT